MRIPGKSFLFLALVAIFVSCSSDETFEIQKNQVENAKIVIDLQKVNQELLSTVPSGTRGWNKWNKEEKLKVVCADLTGAWAGAKFGLSFGAKIGLGIGAPHLVGGGACVLGALVGGAYASWMAAPTRATVVEDDFQKIGQSCRILVNEDMSVNENAIKVVAPTANEKININQELIDEARLDQKSLDIAKMHNIILLTLDGSVVLQPEINEELENGGLKEELLNSEEFMDGCREIGVNARAGYICSSDLVLNTVMGLFNEVIEGYVSKADDVAFIIGKYIDVIEASDELTEEQKEIIKSGLATSLYSAKYWEEKSEEPTN